MPQYLYVPRQKIEMLFLKNHYKSKAKLNYEKDTWSKNSEEPKWICPIQ